MPQSPRQSAASALPIPFNKAIANLWLSVTDVCNMRCKYCFVSKGTCMMTRDTARGAIDFFLAAPSDQKRIDYYGGEPLLNKKLLQWSMPYALEQGEKLGRDVRTYISTNATLYTSDMAFLRDCDVHVLVSIDGAAPTHDAIRRMKDGSPSHHRVAQAVEAMVGDLEPHNLCALFTVSPRFADRMLENYQALLDMGFRCVNVEPERSEAWTREGMKTFGTNLKHIAGHVLRSVQGPKEQWLYLNSISRRLAVERGTVQQDVGCPFFENFIVYPDGTCSTPPTIVFEELRDMFGVGSVHGGLYHDFEQCLYDATSQPCRDCEQRGTAAEMARDHGVQMLRNRILNGFVDEVVKRSRSDAAYTAYVDEADKWTYV